MKIFTILKSIVLLISLSHSPDGNGQTSTLRFKHLTIENGLSHNTIKCMIEDKKGYLWFGTGDGLNRYDGYTFKVYKFDPRDTSSLPQNEITALWADSEGTIWVGTGGGGLSRFNPSTETFTEYKPRENKETYRSISKINEDSEGMMWIGTYAGTLHRFNKHTGEFSSNYELDFNDLPDSSKNKLGHERILTLYKDRSGTLWIGNMTGLHKLNLTPRKKGAPSQVSFTHYKNSPGSVFTIYQDRSGFIWLNSSGLNRFDPASQTFTHYRHDPKNPNTISNDFISQIAEDKEGNLWLSTLGGLNKLNKERTQFTAYVNNITDPSSISNNYVSSMLLDKSGTLWLGTIGNGISKTSLIGDKFAVYHHNPLQSNSLSDKEVTAICEDSKGIVWIGTSKGGLNRFDRKTGKFTHYWHNPSNPKSLWQDYISEIIEDKEGNLWISHENKISKINPDTGEFEHSIGNARLDEIISQSRIYTFYEDKQGLLWIGIETGLIQYDRNSKQYILYTHDPLNRQGLGDYQVQTVREDSKGNLWIGHGSLALTKFHKKTGKFTWYKHNKYDSTSISSVYIKSIFEDSKENIWFGTIAGGLCLYNAETDNFTTFTERDGLANNTIYSILEDNRGNLWLGTNKGLSRFSLSTHTFTNYDANDGLQSNQFAGGYLNFGSCFKSKDGTLYFGGNNGFNVFDPGKLEKNSYVPPIVLTSFRLFDMPVAGKHEMKAIELSYDQNFFSFEFAALNYTNSSKNQYAYMLEGLEEVWVQSGTRRFVNYTDISPGEYTFRVKGSNNDGLWNEQGTSIQITILPPWWRTIWAYGFYMLLFVGVLMGFINFRTQRIRERQEVELKRREAKHLQEVNEIKNRFFSNVTHEFRTPLTLILAPTQRLLQRLTTLSPYYMDVEAVERNARHLLRLVNELLDLSKMEAGSLPVSETRGNIISFTAQLVESFRTAAHEKQIILSFQGATVAQEHLFDADKWEKIMGNLLSNALKFTPTGGQVQVECHYKTSNLLQVSITDTGIGIAAEKLPFIFDRFYQADDSRTRTYEGSGIGLALVRELLQLLRGQIAVKSSLGSGTTFMVELPVKMADGKENVELVSADTTEVLLPALAENNPPLLFEESLHAKPLILVVEDNMELLNFIEQLLQPHYRVLTATNGREGLSTARRELPEVVISDVMMPEMDGYALCEALKTDPQTDHIALLLLTARSSQTSRLEGLSLGADDYITKPFHLEELGLRLHNLLDRQEKLREYYRKQWNIQGTATSVPSAKDTFIEKLYSIIEANLDDPALDPEKLASEVAMSVRTLNRKLNTLMGIPAAKLIRIYRLKKAAEFLKNGYTVSDTAYQVGFESPSYFATAFKEYYQKTPSEYVAY